MRALVYTRGPHVVGCGDASEACPEHLQVPGSRGFSLLSGRLIYARLGNCCHAVGREVTIF
jgi:hypothetical protein